MKWLLLVLLVLAGCGGTDRRLCVEVKNSLEIDIVLRVLTGLPFPFDRRDYRIKAGVTMQYHLPAGLRPREIKLEVRRKQ